MQNNSLLTLKLKFIFILFLALPFIECCKKTDIQFTNQSNLKSNVQNLKKLFDAGQYKKELVNNYMDTIHIDWSPDWNKAKQKVKNDTITYVYIPLNGKIRTKKYPCSCINS